MNHAFRLDSKRLLGSLWSRGFVLVFQLLFSRSIRTEINLRSPIEEVNSFAHFLSCKCMVSEKENVLISELKTLVNEFEKATSERDRKSILTDFCLKLSVMANFESILDDGKTFNRFILFCKRMFLMLGYDAPTKKIFIRSVLARKINRGFYKVGKKVLWVTGSAIAVCLAIKNIHGGVDSALSFARGDVFKKKEDCCKIISESKEGISQANLVVPPKESIQERKSINGNQDSKGRRLC